MSKSTQHIRSTILLKRCPDKLGFPEELSTTLIFGKENLKNDTRFCKLSAVCVKREYVIAFFSLLFTISYFIKAKITLYSCGGSRLLITRENCMKSKVWICPLPILGCICWGGTMRSVLYVVLEVQPCRKSISQWRRILPSISKEDIFYTGSGSSHKAWQDQDSG